MLPCDPPNPSGGLFQSTRWSLVLRAGDPGTEEGFQALSELCAIYWPPLYGFARRKGLSAEDAEDATQGFFSRLIEKGTFRDANPEKGRLRTFLLAVFECWLADERGRRAAIKRGGRTTIVSIDRARAEKEFGLEPADPMTPERWFHRAWAFQVLAEAMRRLELDWGPRGHLNTFRSFVMETGAGSPQTIAAAARVAGLAPDHARVIVYRLRERFRHCLWETVADTLESRNAVEVKGEIFALRRALET